MVPVHMRVASLSTLSQTHWNVALAHVFSTVFIAQSYIATVVFT